MPEESTRAMNQNIMPGQFVHHSQVLPVPVGIGQLAHEGRHLDLHIANSASPYRYYAEEGDLEVGWRYLIPYDSLHQKLGSYRTNCKARGNPKDS